MGIPALIVAAVSTAYSAYESNQARKEQRAAASEQRAQNKSDAMREHRNQIREERVRQAAILQASQAAGTSASSGEIGAIGSLTTTLESNIGTNLGKLQTAQNISIFQQNAADTLNRAETVRQVSSLASSFASSGTKVKSSGS